MEASSNSANYNHLLNQFHVINECAGNKTLSIDQKTGDLTLYNPSSMGRLFQIVTGYGSSDWQAVAQNINSLVEETKQLLPNKDSLTQPQLLKLKDELINASDKIKHFASSGGTAENELLTLANSINDLSQQIISEEYEEDFYLLPSSSNEMSESEDWNIIEKDGDVTHVEMMTKPHAEGLLGKLGRIVETTRLWSTQTRANLSSGIKFPAPWEQLTSPIVNHFLNNMATTVSFKPVNEFYMKEGMNNLSLDQIKQRIDISIGSTIDQPIAIPVLLSGKESLSRDHIVAIIIKDGTVEYFDSMGITSDQQQLANGTGTIRDVLEYCKERYALNSIEENTHQLQSDIHSCGTFVCQFFIRRLEKDELVGATPTEINRNELLEVRDRIANEVIPMMENELEEIMAENEKPAFTSEADDWSDEDLMDENKNI